MTIASATRPNPQHLERVLAVYYLTAIVLLGLTHWYIAAVDGNEITVASTLILFVFAIIYALFTFAYRKPLRKHAYAPYLIHVSTYLLVNLSYWMHAFWLGMDGSFNGDQIETSDIWMGATISMPLFWGLGLLAHTFSAWSAKGYEDAEI